MAKGSNYVIDVLTSYQRSIQLTTHHVIKKRIEIIKAYLTKQTYNVTRTQVQKSYESLTFPLIQMLPKSRTHL